MIQTSYMYISIACLAALLTSSCNTSSKYQLIDERFDDTYLLSEGNIIVGSTIADSVFESEYIVGIRIPVRFLKCKYSHKSAGEFVSSEIRFTDEDQYFIVNRATQQVTLFSEKSAFEKTISSLGVVADGLSYEKVVEVRQTYESVYVRDTMSPVECYEYPKDTKEYQKSTY